MKTNAHLWETRSWNSPRGRLLWYAKRYRAEPSHMMKFGLRLAYAYAVNAVGEVEARAVYKREGMPIPAFLVAGNKPAPPPTEPAELAFAVDNLPIGCIRTGARRRAA